ncbi:hypothetical protein ALC57_01063 [Trachymyrmex cornetzi]|uniref:Uncharacterized protein n=1 Tax=Trachymyrmex cornetzi TaxID=471704 RepID=A0A151JQM3_9HYME|nr:hypothetical protein ALC57_01063 [Trachymyrmex cornetzi]
MERERREDGHVVSGEGKKRSCEQPPYAVTKKSPFHSSRLLILSITRTPWDSAIISVISRINSFTPGEERLPVPLMGHRLIAWNARIRPQPKKPRERQKKMDESSVTEDRGFFCEFYASRSSSGAVQ